jgi:hypothetical protein
MGTLAGAVRYPEMDSKRVTPEDINFAEFMAMNAHLGGNS